MSMKKTLAVALSLAMALSLATLAMAASDAAYPVGSVSQNAYLYDSDKYAVDLTNPQDGAAYGDTLYFPLINTTAAGSSQAVANAQAALTAKQNAYNAAVAAQTAAQTAADQAAVALAAATASKTLADAVKTAADAWKTAVDTSAPAQDIADAQQAYEDALLAFDPAAVPAATADEAVTAADALVVSAATAVTNAQTAKDAADAALAAANTAVTTAASEVTAAQAALDAAISDDFAYVYESDAVRSIKIKQDWEMNRSIVKDVEIVKKKAVASSTLPENYLYFVAVTLDDSSSTSSVDLVGTISLRKSGEFDYEDCELDVNLPIGYPTANDTEITDKAQVFKEGVSFVGDSEEEFTFSADYNSYFTVNTVGQNKLLLAMDTKFDSSIAAKYPSANLDFFNGNGGSFNKIGTLTLSADEDSYIYRINSDGSLTAVNADYDEYEEAYLIRTRKLDRYVISDIELETQVDSDDDVVVVEPDDNTDGSGTINPNPSTGAGF